MAKHKIISIVRASGSGGGLIAARTAEILGIKCYDQQLVEMALRLGDLDTAKHADLFKKMDEHRPNQAFYRVYKEGNVNVIPDASAADQLFDLEKKLMQQFAQNEDAIIVGRCSNWVLEHEDVELLSVFATAPLEARIRRVMRNSDMDETAARRHIRKTDRQRDDFYYYMTHRERDDYDNYRLVLNTGEDDEDLCAKMLAGAFKAL